ncbi:MAG: NAD-dependent epimerase/dehydratase family protein, partial [Candidatus Aminicenantes bacterium]|nr:NAD-dependent epimerase/dehydratase family protein [Candidatus Aminicenantes bacterium]
MKKALVCGAGGFIASHLVKRLRSDGYWVRGVDIKHPEFSPSAAHEFLLLDLREEANCRAALAGPPGYAASGLSAPPSGPFDEVFQLA